MSTDEQKELSKRWLKNRWHHSVCDECWNKTFPGELTPHRIVGRMGTNSTVCCWCGQKHGSGILIQGHETCFCLDGRWPHIE